MARHKNEQATIVSISKLDKLAEEHEKTGKTLRKLAKAFRGLLSGLASPEVQEAVMKRRKGGLRAGKGHSTAAPQPQKRKGMSKAARKKLSDGMRLRWEERKAQAAAKEATPKNDKKQVTEGNAA